MANLSDYKFPKDPEALKTYLDAMSPLDLCVLAGFRETQELALKELEQFNVHAVWSSKSIASNTLQATQELLSFCQNLGSFYLDRSKMTLYFTPASSLRRRATQTACHFLLCDLLRFLSPVFSLLTEEAWQVYFGSHDQQSSVHLQSFDSCLAFNEPFSWENVGKRLSGLEDVKKTWENLTKVRQYVSVSLEEKRGKSFKDSFQTSVLLNIHDSPEGKYRSVSDQLISSGQGVFDFLRNLGDTQTLADFFLVSELTVMLVPTPDPEASFQKLGLVSSVEVNPLPAQVLRCLRCRRYNVTKPSSSELGTNSEFEPLCGLCNFVKS